MVVQHNLRAMNSNRMLGLTQAQQAKSSEKLSSGYKINRAADDAAGLSISEKMRKQIRGLTQASLNAQDGISAVQTAEGALHEVQDMLQRMNELAVKASNGTNSEDDRSYIQDEIDQLITEIDRVSETTKFNETYLLKGDRNAERGRDFQYKDAQMISQDLYYVKDGKVETLKKGTLLSAVDSTNTYYSNSVGPEAGEKIHEDNVSSYFESKTVVDGTDAYFTKGDDGNFYEVKKGTEFDEDLEYYTSSAGGGIPNEFTLIASDDVSTSDYYFVKANVTVYDSATGNLMDENDHIGDDSTVGSDYYATKVNYVLGPDSIDYDDYKTVGKVQFVDDQGNEIAENGLYRYLDKDGNLLPNSGLFIKTGEGLTDRIEAKQSDVDSMVNKEKRYLVGDLELSLHVGADSTKNNQITLNLSSISANVLGVDDIKVSGKDDKNALNAIEVVKEAIQKVSTQRSALGAVQNRLEHTINNLDNVVENTTAAESQIRDTDMATEMVKFSNNNILAQAGQAMLAQSNQANQGVLSLLG